MSAFASASAPTAADIPDISNIQNEFDNFMFDLDGVIMQGGLLIDGVAEAIAHLQQHDKSVFFLSNNSTKSRRMYAEKLRELGLVRLHWCANVCVYGVLYSSTYMIDSNAGVDS